MSGRMVFSLKVFCLVSFTLLSTGCATGLNSVQEHEYVAYEVSDVLIKEKDPVIGAWLGVLPGGGSFYAREPGYGIVSLLFWPLSIVWDTTSGYDGSKSINYVMTKSHISKKMNDEIELLDDELNLDKINSSTYVLEKNKIKKKYKY